MSILSHSTTDDTIIIGLSKAQFQDRMGDVAGESVWGLVMLNLKLFLRAKRGVKEEALDFGDGEPVEMDSLARNILHVVISIIVVAVYCFIWRRRFKKQTTLYKSRDTLYIDQKLFSSTFDLRYVAVQKRWKFPLMLMRKNLYNIGIVSGSNSIVLGRKYKEDEANVFAQELADFLGVHTQVVRKITPEEGIV